MKRLLLFSITLLFMLTSYAHAKVASAKLAVNVPPGKWKTMRLKNLPERAGVKVDIDSSGAIMVHFINQENFDNYPDTSRPLFQSKVQNKLSFTVKVPAAGHYYLVLDNTTGNGEVKLDVSVTGASGADASSLQESLSSVQDKNAAKDLGRFVTELNKLFIFEPFPINAEICGKEGAFSGPSGISLCLEFIQKISVTFEDREKATSVLLFTVFHEAAHILLSQWGYPFYDNEDIADEFAAAMVIMTGQKERLSAVTEFFLANPSSNELIIKAVKGDRHQLSVQRARNILSWMKDTGRLGRWQNFFIPHMQKGVLEKLQKNTKSGDSLALIQKELSTR